MILVLFASIGLVLLGRNFALNAYGDIPTAADQLVIRYEMPMTHTMQKNDFPVGAPPAMLLYGNGLMLCSDHSTHGDKNLSPLSQLKQRQLSHEEIYALFEKVRTLGFDELLERPIDVDTLAPSGATASVSLITSLGERRLTLGAGEESKQFNAITKVLEQECKKAVEEFDPDSVVLESILTSQPSKEEEAVPELPLPADLEVNKVNSQQFEGEEAAKIKDKVSKGNKVYKSNNGKKLKVRILPKIPEYQPPKLLEVKNGVAKVHAATSRKVRFLYVVAADQAIPSNAQAILDSVATTLPSYYLSQVTKTFSTDGISVVRGSKTVAQYKTCPYGSAGCTINGVELRSLAAHFNLSAEFKQSQYNTIVIHNWDDERCIGWGGPAGATNSVTSDYGFASYSAPSCWQDAYYFLGAHEGGHGFGLAHTCDATLMDNCGYAKPPGYGSPLQAAQAALLRDFSPYFVVTASLPPPVTSGTTFVSVAPSRLLETRPGGSTIDGSQNGIGRRPAGSITEVQVAGRAGLPNDALAVAMTVAAVNPGANGFITAFPCGQSIPTTSNINYTAGNNVANMVISKLGGGKVCIYNRDETDLIADVNGIFPSISIGSYTNISPARILDTRPGSPTADGQQQGTGAIAGGTVRELPIAARVGVPSNASAVSLNVVAVNAAVAGFITVYPCGIPVPTTSNINYKPGGVVANAVISKLGGGKVCIYSSQTADVVVDINGAFNDVTSYKSIAPARLLETRPGMATTDGQFNGIGQRPAGSITEVTIAGRGGVAADALAVVLNVTVANPAAAGFLTVYPCGINRPNSSNVNFAAGAIVANMVITNLGSGKICIYNLVATDIIVDVNGAFNASDTQQSAVSRPSNPAPSPLLPPGGICPSGYTGTWPSCVPPTCPTGYTGTYPNCTPPPCPTGYTGTYPNCVPPTCPSGTTGTYPNCTPTVYLAPSVCKGATAYKDANFTGSSLTLTNTQYDFPLSVGDKAISSVRVPKGCKVTLYQNSGFGGAIQELRGDWVGSTTDPWNDVTSSIKIINDTITASTLLTCPSTGVTLYTNSSWGGTQQVLQKGNYDTAQLGAVGNDTLSSIKVTPGCTAVLYQHSGFSGATKTVLGGGWLGGLSDPWNDITSSIKIMDRGSTNYGTNHAPKMLGLRWSYTGLIAGSNCTEINEPSDPVWNNYRDNYICRTSGNIQFSYAGPIAGMNCVSMNEPSEPAAYNWADNYICTTSPYSLKFSYAGPIAGMTCTLVNETGDPYTWNDNYLCETASVTASTVYTLAGYYAASNATDDTGIVNEWASLGEGAGAWVQLNWPSIVNVGKVKIRDRVNPSDNIQSLTLTFSDGSTVNYNTPFPIDGTPIDITFPARNVNWMRVTVKTSVGPNIGVADIQTFPATGYNSSF